MEQETEQAERKRETGRANKQSRQSAKRNGQSKYQGEHAAKKN